MLRGVALEDDNPAVVQGVAAGRGRGAPAQAADGGVGRDHKLGAGLIGEVERARQGLRVGQPQLAGVDGGLARIVVGAGQRDQAVLKSIRGSALANSSAPDATAGP